MTTIRTVHGLVLLGQAFVTVVNGAALGQLQRQQDTTKDR
jgi:hypothetical protein